MESVTSLENKQEGYDVMYPKTNCNTGNCENVKYDIRSGPPGSLGMNGCYIPESPFFSNDCKTRIPIRTTIEPNVKNSSEPNKPINTLGIPRDIETFYTINQQCGKGIVYSSQDPRLLDVIRYERLTLDQPPLDASVPLSKVYDLPANYGQGYTSYDNISGGQISYYVASKFKDAFFEPVFSSNARVNSYLFRDPMGGTKIEYNRIPLSTPNCLIREDATVDQFTQDELIHRNDIIGLQMEKRLRNEWSPRYPS